MPLNYTEEDCKQYMELVLQQVEHPVLQVWEVSKYPLNNAMKLFPSQKYFSKGRVLDIGCGMGATMYFLQCLYPTMTFKGINKFQCQVDYCKAGGLDVEQYDIADEDHKKFGDFEYLMCNYTMGHLDLDDLFYFAMRHAIPGETVFTIWDMLPTTMGVHSVLGYDLYEPREVIATASKYDFVLTLFDTRGARLSEVARKVFSPAEKKLVKRYTSPVYYEFKYKPEED